MRDGRTSFEVTSEPLRVQMETFLDEHRAAPGTAGHRLGPLPLRWVYLHTLREFAQHRGHADILREQILGAG
jgi:Protein of unknown function (DUF664)